MRPRLALLPTVALLLAMFAGCGKNPPPPTADDIVQQTKSAVPRPNVIIWLVDTLRPDHLSTYGYSRQTSPELDKFGQDAIVFEQAFAPSSWTKPSTASVVTGVNPNRHGAVGNAGRLAGVRLVGEYLQRLSYATAAFTTNPWVLPFWGFGPGFDEFNATQLNLENAPAEVIAAAVREYLARQTQSPFFIYVHTLDPHDGYAPPPPYDTLWGKRLERRAVSGRYETKPPPQPVIDDMIIGYDGEITYGDHHFGAVIDDLKSRGLYDNSLIIFTADHGEEFFEHGHGGHGRTLHRELVHVPLIVKLPNSACGGRRITTPVGSIDIVPTILSYLNVTPDSPLDGRDLLSALTPPKAGAPERPFYFQMDYKLSWTRPREELAFTGVMLGGFKYIEQYKPTAQQMLYDAEQDPGETTNIITQEPQLSADLAALLKTYRARSEPGIHFRNINVIEETAEPHVFHVRFRTDGRFVLLRKAEFEKDDVAELREDDKVLELTLTGENRRERAMHPGQKLRWLVDEDSVLFRVEPPDAHILVEQYSCDQLRGVQLFVGAEKKPVRTLPYEFDLSRAEVRADDIAGLVRATGGVFSLAGPAGGYLAVSPPHETVTESDIDPGMLDRLRTLGYVGDAPAASKHPTTTPTTKPATQPKP